MNSRVSTTAHRPFNTTLVRMGSTVTATCMLLLLGGCYATLTGEPSYVGTDPDGRSVYQAPIWEGGGYFVYDRGARTFLRDR